MQIRSRLTIQFLVIVAGMLLAAMVFIHYQFRNYLEEEHYSNLRSKALMTAEMLLGKEEPVQLSETAYNRNNTLNTKSENITIFNKDYDQIFRFYPSADTIAVATLDQIDQRNEVLLSRGHFKSLGVEYVNKHGMKYFIIADGMFDPVHLQSLTGILIVSFCLLIAVVAFGGWLFAGQALAPVTRIMNQIDEILPSDLSKRLDPTRRADELSRLVSAFNNMLDRIQHVFKHQKLFLSNISHELKNALSVIQSQLEIGLDKPRSDTEYQETLQSVLDDVRGLNMVSDKLMQLARISSDDNTISFERVRIDEMIWQARTNLLKAHPDYRVNLEMDNLPEEVDCLVVSGNEPLLRTALFNLMENGCKFSPDGTVRVLLGQTETGSLLVEICDTGPGIPEDELFMVFEPFYRGHSTSSVKGSGIGLSLVHSIMKLHQVTLRVSSKVNTGTTFRLEFPGSNQLTPIA